MNGFIKKSFIALTCLVLFGGMVMCLSGCKFFARNYLTNEYTVSEEFSDIIVNEDTADIDFVLSTDGVCKVVCYEYKKATHKVSVQDGKLTVNLVETRKWYERMGASLDKITVYLPQGEYGALNIDADTSDIDLPSDLKFESINISLGTGDVENSASANSVKIETSTGDIDVENIVASTIDLCASTGHIEIENVTCSGNVCVSVSTGKVEQTNLTCDSDISITVSTGKTFLTDVKCENLTTTGGTGNILLENVIASEKFDITRSTGDVEFEKCDANEILVETSTGNVKGSFLSDKVYITRTDTGRINVPETITGGKCKITTSTGNIIITIEK